MGLVDLLKKALGRETGAGAFQDGGREPVRQEAEDADLPVPEVTSGELLAELDNGNAKPLLLDIRENFERGQAFIPDSKHIVMNSLPYRLGELDPAQEIVVYCAHGNRSYGVAGWLIQQGYRARSLKGGIVDWQRKHGPVERGYSGKS